MRAFPRQTTWMVGMGCLATMIVLFVLAIRFFKGPTSVILLVLAGLCLLVGVYLIMPPPAPEAPESAAQEPPPPRRA